jgi:hypothetical protein
LTTWQIIIPIDLGQGVERREAVHQDEDKDEDEEEDADVLPLNELMKQALLSHHFQILQ